MRPPARILLPLLVAAAVAAAGAQTVENPRLTRWVTDRTGTLTPEDVAGIEEELRAFADSTSTQVVLLMIPTTGDLAVEEYAFEVARANGIGQKGKDNGVLLLVAREDRKVRIEVGHGLEGVLTDQLSGVIIRSEIAPRFRAGDYPGGLRAGARAIMAATRNEYKAPKKPKSKDDLSSLLPILLLLIVFFVVMRAANRRGGGGGRRGMRYGPFLGPTGGWTGGGRGGTWSSGGGWGGRGGGGFGGFGGGGGGFGGGGASGSW